MESRRGLYLDELLGQAEEPGGDPIYKKQSLDMDALYRVGEAQQVITPGSIGIVYCIRPDNSLLLELSYLPSPWHCEPEEVEPVIPLRSRDIWFHSYHFIKGATPESISALPTYKFKLKKNDDGEGRKTNLEGATCEGGGVVVGVGIEKERTIVGEDAACCICLAKYADNDELRELPCTHFFHMECVDKWLKINALCPLCKYEVGDWVRVKALVSSPKYGWEDVTKSSIGIIHSLEEDGDMGVAFYFRSKSFCCSVIDMEKVPPFEVGQGIHMAQYVV
ncbi:hypothetical protein GIB67_035121 [Kingdonia uniflora]|uniref:RING-type domain-containing protein n=1 Tax=Kingdonia uniflora TaxID=39325 RepID=A0A7J7NW32_9MAGN|nr:hypothetical protein GIB67_035121 [Kingdonia uniflora]